MVKVCYGCMVADGVRLNAKLHCNFICNVHSRSVSLQGAKMEVDAIFDEIPYINLFLDKYGSDYKVVGPTYKTDGFGFKNFGPTYPSSNSLINSINPDIPKLTVYDFGGLFILIGAALLFALFCSETSVGQKLTNIVAHYGQKSFIFISFQGNDSRVHSTLRSDDGNEVQETDHINQASAQGEDLVISVRNGQANESEQGNPSDEIQLSEIGNSNTDAIQEDKPVSDQSAKTGFISNETAEPTSVHIGLIFDTVSPMDAMVDTCIAMAICDFYTSHPDYKTRLILHRRDAQDDLDIVSAATGFAIDIFLYALDLLPFHLDYEFFSPTNESGRSNETYDDLLHGIPNQYDIFVADTTILADRAKYVDFTLPYSAAGTVMVVRNRKQRDIWIFVKPFRWDLWLLIFCTSICIGIVLQILERRANSQPDSIGLRNSRLGLSFPISSLAFPERDLVTNKWAISVMVVWLLMAGILMQSYTANLSAMFTVDQLDYRFSSNDSIGAFPLGSPLVAYFSRAILAVTESVNMTAIQEKNFGPSNPTTSGSQINSVSSESPKLRVYDFGGLFIIIGSALLLALFCSETTVGQKITNKVADCSQKSLFFLPNRGYDARDDSTVHPDEDNQNEDSSSDDDQHQGSDHNMNNINPESGQGDLKVSAGSNGPVNKDNPTNEIQLSELRNANVTEERRIS
ncbi:OLC1v1035391C1 [Oldenlandia corymbosa var. corymbosa]|uniref:OLC1v1035391C1 n=1 Tax=Oldenlandia corymbosa var. corymbosa TaxID=529605 RepID=A0AAV1CUQ8_OLDCO|nr:OLC1v1035391C1 [Oldenlandia corymbosa var. corymbosa]